MRAGWVVATSMAIEMAGLLTAPPYFAIGGASAGLHHASIGHRWRWAPPTPEEAREALRARGQAASASPVQTCSAPADRRSNLQVRVNLVRLTAEVSALMLAGAACLVVWETLTGRRKRSHGAPSGPRLGVSLVRVVL